jgi:hypothetical protein
MSGLDLSQRHIRTDIEMQVVAHDREIHLLFSEKHQDGKLVPAFTSNFLMSAGEAVRFAGLTADLAYEADTGLKPAGTGLKAALVERARIKLATRVALMLRSMREDKTISHQKIAQEVVDACLKEVYT